MGPVSMAEMLADVAKLRRKSMKNNPLVQGGQNFDSEFWSQICISKRPQAQKILPVFMSKWATAAGPNSSKYIEQIKPTPKQTFSAPKILTERASFSNP